VPETAHVFNKREWKQDKESHWYPLNCSVFPGSEEFVISNTALLQKTANEGRDYADAILFNVPY
jgi:hypothetical protein